MDILDQTQLSSVSGGNPLYIALKRGVDIYAGAATLIYATRTLNDLGQTLGKKIYKSTHPDELGQMIYHSFE